MALHSVALVFDDQSRPETTGVYCRSALTELVAVRHFRPSQVEQISAQGFDLYLRVDDGHQYHLPDRLRPQACWLIDTHMDFEWCLKAARETDFVFAAQKDGADRLRQEGIASAVWLPLACDPAIHRKHDIPKTLDWCFVGNVFPGERADLLNLLQKQFPRSFVGQRYFHEMARTFSSAHLVFNRSVRNDINMRVFEAISCGSLLITNDLRDNGQEELFRDGVHLATYRESEELLDKVRFYLAHEEIRERIAGAGREEALARHTYRLRMETLLQGVAGAGRLSLHAKPSTTTNGNQAPTNQSADVRDGWYFDFDRPELLALVPQTARRVLDIGCGAGRLGETLKKRQGAEVVGIEMDEKAAEFARQRLDQVFVGDVEKVQLSFGPASFDAVLCGDVLEHLRRPERLIQQIHDWLRPGGLLIASIPNARHHSVVGPLLAGNWTYEAAGLLDQTHLRFFTRRGIEELFRRSGFHIRRLQVTPGPGFEEWDRQGRPRKVRVGHLHLEGMPVEDIEEFFVYQYVVTAEAVSAASPFRELASHAPAPLSRPHSPAPPPILGPMKFTQDFLRDFDQFDFFGPPFAFVRFADGERSVCMGQPISVSRDGWAYAGGPSVLVDDMLRALRYSAPDYYIGISDACCDRPARDWYLQHITVPLNQVTFSNIFINANYRRFRRLNLHGTVVVGSGQADFKIPANLFAGGFDIDRLVDDLTKVDRPILVAAGPASAVIIHKYWLRAQSKQPIVDVGSALDEWTKGHKTRPYMFPGSRTAQLVCTW